MHEEKLRSTYEPVRLPFQVLQNPGKKNDKRREQMTIMDEIQRALDLGRVDVDLEAFAVALAGERC
jgi:hypothetical protein